MSHTRILVVEDDPDGQEMVATMLEHMNFPVDIVGNAEDALDHLLRGQIDYRAVIIDLALPGMDGWELLSTILGNPNTSGIPCIAVTAYHTFKMREDAITAGFSAYLPKPIDSMTLGRELERLVS
jgi:CheY-like chemotaxis protein